MKTYKKTLSLFLIFVMSISLLSTSQAYAYQTKTSNASIISRHSSIAWSTGGIRGGTFWLLVEGRETDKPKHGYQYHTGDVGISITLDSPVTYTENSQFLVLNNCDIDMNYKCEDCYVQLFDEDNNKKLASYHISQGDTRKPKTIVLNPSSSGSTSHIMIDLTAKVKDGDTDENGSVKLNVGSLEMNGKELLV